MTEQNYQEVTVSAQDGLKLYYRDYNQSGNDKTPLLCLHGLTRNSKDFHDFASHFCKERRIISVDVRGRGQSEYDATYMNYQIPTYVNDVLHILASTNIHHVIAVGTSMGGLITMGMAMARPGVLKAAALNDIGPEINPAGLARIGQYAGKTGYVSNWDEAAGVIKMINQDFFPDYTQEDWMKFARNTFAEKEDGTIVPDYDANIGRAMAESKTTVAPEALWAMFQGLCAIPVLAIRGETSDILAPETLDKMHEVHPNLTKAIIPNRGHAPDLTEKTSIEFMENFLKNLS